MMIDCKTSLEWMAACRPAGEDLADPELADLAAHLEDCAACLKAFRIQQGWDARVGRAIRDVPLPPGLEARLLARLAERPSTRVPEASSTADSSVVPLSQPPADTSCAAAAPHAASRRRHLAALAGAMVATAAAVIAVLLLNRHTLPTPREPAALALEGIAAFEDVEFALPTNNPDKVLRWIRATLGSTAALPSTLNLSRLAGCGRSKILGRDVAVLFYTSGALSAKVYVFPADPFDVQAGAFPEVQQNTQGKTAWVWTEGSLTFVCVISAAPGDPQRLLERFTRPSTGPLT